MTLEIEGTVSLGDEYRVESEGKLGAVHIGDIDLVRAAQHFFDRGDRACLAIFPDDKEFKGPVNIQLGYGDIDWHPVQEDRFYIGDEDIIGVLDTFLGQDIAVVMWKEDE